jgi:hypothetical protein
VVNGVVNLALNYIHAIQAPALRQYWNLYYQGYISQSELLAWSGASSMLHFFQVAGADPNFVTPLRTQRQNRQITDAQLINLMGLDNIDQVNQVLGLDWRMAVDVRDQLYMDGFDISFANAQELTSAYVEDLSALNSADAALLQGLIGEMADLGMGDIPMEYRSLIISETLDELVETIAEENSQSASYSSNTQNILVSSNAFVDAMGQKNNSTKKKAVLATAESAINTNFIQSNIALAMRQIEGEQESVGSFQVDPHVSSFGSVSFASPFENDSLVGASNKVG